MMQDFLMIMYVFGISKLAFILCSSVQQTARDDQRLARLVFQRAILSSDALGGHALSAFGQAAQNC